MFDENKTPACSICNTRKVFEFQINSMILDYISELINLEWGIIAVYTCPNSCQPKDGKIYEKEFIALQKSPEEEDKEFMRKVAVKRQKEEQNVIDEELEENDKEGLIEEKKQTDEEKEKEEKKKEKKKKQKEKKKLKKDEDLKKMNEIKENAEKEDSEDNWS